MRRIIIFAMILIFIFAMVGCTAHNEPGKNTVVSSSSNAVFHVTQAEDLSEKTKNETVDKSTFAEGTTQSFATKIGTEKVSEEPFFLKPQQQIPSRSKIFIRKQNRPKAKNLSLQS